MSVVLIWLLIVIDMCYFLPIEQQIAKKVGSAAKVNYYYSIPSNSDLDQNWKMNFI